MKDKQTAKAVSKYIRISSHKVRRVLDQIRGRSYLEALMSVSYTHLTLPTTPYV